MSRFAFVDTAAWFAAVVPWDANHASAAAWFDRNERPLITTDYIVDELSPYCGRVAKASERLPSANASLVATWRPSTVCRPARLKRLGKSFGGFAIRSGVSPIAQARWSSKNLRAQSRWPSTSISANSGPSSSSRDTPFSSAAVRKYLGRRSGRGRVGGPHARPARRAAIRCPRRVEFFPS